MGINTPLKTGIDLDKPLDSSSPGLKTQGNLRHFCSNSPTTKVPFSKVQETSNLQGVEFFRCQLWGWVENHSGDHGNIISTLRIMRSQVTGGLEIPEPCRKTGSNPSFLEAPMILRAPIFQATIFRKKNTIISSTKKTSPDQIHHRIFFGIHEWEERYIYLPLDIQIPVQKVFKAYFRGPNTFSGSVWMSRVHE